MNTPTLIAILMIIITSIIIKIRTKGWKVPSLKKKKISFNLEKLKEILKTTTIAVVLIIVILFSVKIVFSTIGGINDFFNPPKERFEGSYTKHVTQVINYIHVDFDGEYGHRISLEGYPNNLKFNFINATQPYTVVNDYGIKGHSPKGGDASGQLGYTNGNLGFRFRSTNGLKGSLIIKVFVIKNIRVSN